MPPQRPLSDEQTMSSVFLPSASSGFVSAASYTSLEVSPYLRESVMARWARLSLVEATIFMVLVIFSMLRIDLRRPSISRSVAYVATVGVEAAAALFISVTTNQYIEN